MSRIWSSLPVLALGVAIGLAASLVQVTPGVQAKGETQVGPFGPEGPRMREQLWMLPSATPGVQLRATVFRPPEDGFSAAGAARRPLVIINHGTSEATRHAVSLPVYYWLSRWFVDRGYIVVLPQRRGHGATGGALVEAVGDCSNPDHMRSGSIAADDIQQVVEYMARQSFVAPDKIVVAGISTGGWASLALAARNLQPVRAVINFAGGRGAYAWGRAGEICGEERLIAAAAHLGGKSQIPTLWLYARNDSFFGPGLARRMADAWDSGGGRAELHLLPSYGTEGHSLADDRAGWNLWGSQLETFLSKSLNPAVARASVQVSR